MNSKERVLAAFEHREPDRVPLWYGASAGLTAQLMRECQVADEEALMRALNIDFRRVHERYVGPDLGNKTFWGIERGGEYYGQPLTHPLADVETVEQVLAYPHWPLPTGSTSAICAVNARPGRITPSSAGRGAVVFTRRDRTGGHERILHEDAHAS